jgi:hypothetical protein
VACRAPSIHALRCIVLAACALLALTGCKSTGGARTGAGTKPVPTISEIASAWNARVARLDRLWARAAVTMRYLDAEGQRQSAQGEGHLQRLDWYKVALSAGKVGETLFWFGADEDRYWFFDLSDSNRRRVIVGRHDQLTRDKGAMLSIPVPPRQYMRFAGLSAFPTRLEDATVKRLGPELLEVRFHDRSGAWVYHLEQATLYPVMIASLDADGEFEVRSTLSEYRTVILETPGETLIQAAGRFVIEDVPSGTSITIAIDGQMIDGRRANKPKPGAFDFEALAEALGPLNEVIDLDATATMPDEILTSEPGR